MVLAAGCVFDSSGPAFGPAGQGRDRGAPDRIISIRDQNRGESQDPWPPTDLVPDRPVPDMGPLDLPPHDRLRPDLGPLDQNLVQGSTCADPRVSFKASAPPSKCAKLNVRVKGDAPFGWVLVGVSASGSTAPAAWRGNATVVSCNPGYCWDFNTVSVPCAAGPYTFYFMKDATGDDPKKGKVVGSCTP